MKVPGEKGWGEKLDWPGVGVEWWCAFCGRQLGVGDGAMGHSAMCQKRRHCYEDWRTLEDG